MSSQDSKARANVMHSVGTSGMSMIIINNCNNPALKFKFCSVFSAKNPTVNDASGVTMLSERSCSRGGDDFWCASRTTTTTVCSGLEIATILVAYAPEM